MQSRTLKDIEAKNKELIASGVSFFKCPHCEAEVYGLEKCPCDPQAIARYKERRELNEKRKRERIALKGAC